MSQDPDRRPFAATTAPTDQAELNRALREIRPTVELRSSLDPAVVDDVPTTATDRARFEAALAADRRPDRPPIPGIDLTAADSGPTRPTDQAAFERALGATRRSGRPGPAGFDLTDPESGPTEAVDAAAFEAELRAEIAARAERSDACPAASTELAPWPPSPSADLPVDQRVATLAELDHGIATGRLGPPSGVVVARRPRPTPRPAPLGPSQMAAPGRTESGASRSAAPPQPSPAAALAGIRQHRNAILLFIGWPVLAAVSVGLSFVWGGALLLAAGSLLFLQWRLLGGLWRFGRHLPPEAGAAGPSKVAAIGYGIAVLPAAALAVVALMATIGISPSWLSLRAFATLSLAALIPVGITVLLGPIASFVGAIFAMRATAALGRYLGDERAVTRSRRAIATIVAYLVLSNLGHGLFALRETGALVGGSLLLLVSLVLAVLAGIFYLMACSASAAGIETAYGLAPVRPQPRAPGVPGSQIAPGRPGHAPGPPGTHAR